jgi:hypothetical protein
MPAKQSLRRYNLSSDEFDALLACQGGVCAICKQVPSTGRWVVDHEHVRNWKRMKPDRRKQYIRGVLCWWCNYAYLARGMTAQKARRIAAYLEAYDSRAA